jgi:hypothetical protein
MKALGFKIQGGKFFAEMALGELVEFVRSVKEDYR